MGRSLALHFGQAGGSGSGSGTGHAAGAAQQQPGVVPQATTQPHGFTAPDFDRRTG